jgi:hypothetical protein
VQQTPDWRAAWGGEQRRDECRRAPRGVVKPLLVSLGDDGTVELGRKFVGPTAGWCVVGFIEPGEHECLLGLVAIRISSQSMSALAVVV